MDGFISDFPGGDLFGGKTIIGTVSQTAGCCMVLDFSSLAMQTLTGLSSARVTTSIGNNMSKDQIYMYENEHGFPIWTDGFLDRFLGVLSVLRPSIVIVAIDCKEDNWRKSIYADYKFGRKGKIGYLSCVDWKLFTKAKNDMIEYLKNIGMLCIETSGAEADDIIYCIARARNNVVVVSVDGDMNQLAKWGAKIYNPVKRSFVEDMDAAFFLEAKVISGDGGDYIHSIKGTFTSKKAIWPITYINKSSVGGVLNYLMEHEEENAEINVPLPSGDKLMRMSDIYIRNKQLIDMEHIPQDIIDSIMADWQISAQSLRYDADAASAVNTKYTGLIARYIKMI